MPRSGRLDGCVLGVVVAGREIQSLRCCSYTDPSPVVVHWRDSFICIQSPLHNACSNRCWCPLAPFRRNLGRLSRSCPPIVHIACSEPPPLKPPEPVLNPCCDGPRNPSRSRNRMRTTRMMMKRIRCSSWMVEMMSPL